MPDVPRSEFLPKPRWRTRASSRQLALGITVTFAAVLAFGLFLLWLIHAALDWLDAPAIVTVVLWVALTVGTTTWALVARSAATSSEMEYQPWSEYAVRYVMVGNERARPRPHRTITGLVFGAPVGIYRLAEGLAIVTGLL